MLYRASRWLKSSSCLRVSGSRHHCLRSDSLQKQRPSRLYRRKNHATQPKTFDHEASSNKLEICQQSNKLDPQEPAAKIPSKARLEIRRHRDLDRMDQLSDPLLPITVTKAVTSQKSGLPSCLETQSSCSGSSMTY